MLFVTPMQLAITWLNVSISSSPASLFPPPMKITIHPSSTLSQLGSRGLEPIPTASGERQGTAWTGPQPIAGQLETIFPLNYLIFLQLNLISIGPFPSVISIQFYILVMQSLVFLKPVTFVCALSVLTYSYSSSVFHLRSTKNSQWLPWGSSTSTLHSLSSHRHSPPAIVSTWWENWNHREEKHPEGFLRWLPAKGAKERVCFPFWGTGSVHQVVVRQDGEGDLYIGVCTDYHM